MGIEEEADRTLFIRNLDHRVTEELLFELFLQAGPLIRTKIPKDTDGKQKTFGFAVYKHEVSVPYAMELLNGESLFGRSLHVQFRSGSSHSSSSGTPGSSSSTNTPTPNRQRMPNLYNSPPYTPPPQMQRLFSPPDNLQKHAMMNNMMWQIEQTNSGFSKPLQRQSPSGGNLRQQDSTPYRHYPTNANSGGRNQRYGDQSGSGRYQPYSPRDNHHQQGDRSSSRHYEGRGGNRNYDDRGNNRSYQDSRWRRY